MKALCRRLPRVMNVAGCVSRAGWLLLRGHGARFLGRSFPEYEWSDRLPPEAGRDSLSPEAINFWPFVGIVIGSEDSIDPGKVDGKVLIDTFVLRSMVPMMISGHNQIPFEPFRIRTEIAVNPGRVKGDENQVDENDWLRKSKHKRSENKSAHQCVVDEVGA